MDTFGLPITEERISQIVGERFDMHSEEYRKARKAVWACLHQVAIAQAQLSETQASAGWCPRCKGSGEAKGMTQGHGPDDYEIDIPCPECNGTGAGTVPSETRVPSEPKPGRKCDSCGQIRIDEQPCSDTFCAFVPSAVEPKEKWEPGTPRVVCAAIRDKSGRIVTGARHFDTVMLQQIKRGPEVDAWRGAEQGFIDQFGNFLTREEAMVIATKWGQIIRDDEGRPSLYSENLY